jgi:hypothetical protein
MRTFLPHWRSLSAALSAGLLFSAALAAAKTEGKIVLYTANFLARFSERFLSARRFGRHSSRA